MDTKNMMIGFFSLTAAVLLAGLIFLAGLQNTVRASGMTTSGGEYVMTIGREATGDEDFVYVVDNVAVKMIAYRFNPQRGQIEIVQGVELDKLRDAGSQPRRPGRRP